MAERAKLCSSSVLVHVGEFVSEPKDAHEERIHSEWFAS
jgi:hypothetical protein